MKMKPIPKKDRSCWNCKKNQKCVRAERFDLKGCENWVDENE